MAYSFQLPPDKPENKTQVEEIIYNLVQTGRGKRNPQSIRWYISNFYMQGLREFSNIDYTNGTVQIAYLNEAGILKFRFEDIVAKYQAQLGRLMAMNLSPAIGRKGISLDGMRKSSVAQVVLDEAFPPDKVKQLSLRLAPALLMYGTVGLGLWVEGEDSIGIDVIHPWELFPIPTDIAGPTDVRGIMRIRFVPTEWVKNLRITPGANSKEFKKVDEMKLPRGVMPVEIDANGDGLISMSNAGGGFYIKAMDPSAQDMSSGKKVDRDKTNAGITQLVEVWTETSDGYLAEYLVLAGMTKLVQLYRKDHTAGRYPMPTRVVRDITVGSFWGRSFVDLQMPLNRELELALSSVFQSVADFDLYGLLLWPNTLGTPPLAQRGQDGLKVLRYEPDYTTPDLKIQPVQPAKMTGPQLDAVKVAVQLMDKIANQPSQMMAGDAPGRTDSGAGFSFLWETSGIPLSPTSKNIADGVSGIYRAMLRLLKDFWPDQKVVAISQLDDSLAGIILDPQDGTLSLSKNAIPHPDEVNVSIASEVPISKEQQKMELKEALEKQRITLEEYSFEVRKKGLDLPVGLEVEWQNYRRAMLENIILFGDGETPGTITVSERDFHRIHLRVLDAFMARPEFYASSQKVRDMFVKHYEEHKYGQATLPEGMPAPEEAA
jgi:hypothetical protein